MEYERLNKNLITQKTILSFCACILIVLLGLFSYSNTFHSPFVFDDICRIVNFERIHLDSISSNTLVQLWHNIRGNRPVSMFSFALNYYFGGLDTFGYHLVNLLIHLLTAVLIYSFLNLTLNLPCLKERYGNRAQEIALLSSLLFVVHPIQTQAVTYIIQRITSLAAMFYMMSLLAYVKGRIAGGRKGMLWYVASALSAVLALGSKEHTVTLPLIVILYEVFFFQKLDLKNNKKKLGGLALGIMLPLNVWVVYAFDFREVFVTLYEKYPFTMSERVLTELRVVIYYIGLLLFPLPSRLNLDHEFSISHSLFAPPSTIISLLLIIGLVIIAVRIARRDPLLSFSIFWFLVTLFPESSIVPIELIYEHRLYLPSIGFFLLLSVFLIKAIERIKVHVQIKQQIKVIILLALIMLLSTMTYQRNKVWQDSVVFWEDVIAKSPYKFRPYYSLGEVYMARREFDKAISYYLKAIELRPVYSEAYNNLGCCYFFNGDIENAIVATQKALQFDDKNMSAHYSLGIYYREAGEIASAADEFKKALKIKPGYQGAIVALKDITQQINAQKLNLADGDKVL